MSRKSKPDGVTPSGLYIGAKVTSDFVFAESDLVRTLDQLLPDASTSSGFRAAADDGGPCPHCGRPMGTRIHLTDSRFFKLVAETESQDMTAETEKKEEATHKRRGRKREESGHGEEATTLEGEIPANEGP